MNKPTTRSILRGASAPLRHRLQTTERNLLIAVAGLWLLFVSLDAILFVLNGYSVILHYAGFLGGGWSWARPFVLVLIMVPPLFVAGRLVARRELMAQLIIRAQFKEGTLTTAQFNELDELTRRRLHVFIAAGLAVMSVVLFATCWLFP